MINTNVCSSSGLIATLDQSTGKISKPTLCASDRPIKTRFVNINDQNVISFPKSNDEN